MTISKSYAKQMDAWLRSRLDPAQPGIAALVVQDNKTCFRAGYGMANVELGVSIRPEMVFRIGSITKQFTSAAILMLMERGKLDVSDPITKFLPDYPTRDHRITIAHLLTHTSGIRSYTDMPESAKVTRNDRTLDEHIAFFKDQPIDFVPGERWHYNNSGYFLLGAIIEKVSGQTYEAFLQKHIFDKLGMTNTHYDMPNKIIPNRAAGYSTGPNGLENAMFISMTQPYAAGALASSVDDLAKWDAALYGRKILKQATLKHAWTSHILKNGEDTHYGYGWSVERAFDLDTSSHGGGIPGFSTYALRIPAHRLFVAVFANTNEPTLDPNFVAWQLALNAVGQPLQTFKAIPLSKRMLASVVGKYRVNEHITLIFTRQAAQLFVQFWEGMPPRPIHAMSASEFALQDSFMRFEYVPGKDAQPATIRVHDKNILRDTATKLP